MVKDKVKKEHLHGDTAWQVPKAMTIMSIALGMSASAYAVQDYTTGQSEITLPSRNVQQQNRITIKGTVHDNSGEPVVGANVKESGTANGTITDMDGNFTLSVPTGRTIEVSYLGYTTQTFKAVGNKTYDIKLQEDSKNLEEVVVIGYGVQKKVDLSGSVATADTKLLKDRPVVNVGQALQGSVANLNDDRQWTGHRLAVVQHPRNYLHQRRFAACGHRRSGIYRHRTEPHEPARHCTGIGAQGCSLGGHLRIARGIRRDTCHHQERRAGETYHKL